MSKLNSFANAIAAVAGAVKDREEFQTFLFDLICESAGDEYRQYDCPEFLVGGFAKDVYITAVFSEGDPRMDVVREISAILVAENIAKWVELRIATYGNIEIFGDPNWSNP